MEPDATPRKLTRSTETKYIYGVGDGLGRYFGVDPLIFRVGFAVSLCVGGIGLPAYLALALFLPADDGRPAWIENRSRATTVIVIVALGGLAVAGFSPGILFGPGLIALGAVTVMGVAVWRGYGTEIREDPARAVARATLALLGLVAVLGAATGVGFIAAVGGGVAIAALSIFGGLTLIAAGLLGGPRWIILPVVIVVLPLAVVSALNIDLTGGVGQHRYGPKTAADLQSKYRVGIGQVDLDLRGVTLPAGQTEVHLSVGMGEARVRMPAGACAATAAKIGVGAADIPKRADEGADITINHPNQRAQLVVRADIGVGHLQIDQSAACA
jgi:phage shock protein PspC (stress-responsive transcriptional regulator)